MGSSELSCDSSNQGNIALSDVKLNNFIGCYNFLYLMELISTDLLVTLISIDRLQEKFHPSYKGDFPSLPSVQKNHDLEVQIWEAGFVLSFTFPYPLLWSFFSVCFFTGWTTWILCPGLKASCSGNEELRSLCLGSGWIHEEVSLLIINVNFLVLGHFNCLTNHLNLLLIIKSGQSLI